ncbi:hypothetical protein KKC31_00745, partial [Patescibacteria group bacterium]|nr:hypothetical protein [Patescibacteria group bacterium]
GYSRYDNQLFRSRKAFGLSSAISKPTPMYDTANQLNHNIVRLGTFPSISKGRKNRFYSIENARIVNMI